MVKVFLKGGVWKNSEDEILKAAVQKYGKNQWARVASLLNRKTAKQAKARWHEWLDPAIRKTEWSRQEEEKLLNLAKLMPAQWKTIAPLVGRTATQCQEHYEYLLDQAASTSADGSDSARNAAAASLKAGQIDSHPESKPAKPDPIDMDEDELEMLQEARARLANTVGKKAKRKQRERMLAQAKRLADLQKRRELKQAGLLSKQARKKSKVRKQEIDLGIEIPFHKPAPVGFHDVTQEDYKAEQLRQKRLKDVNFHKVNENQYKTRDKELNAMKKREQNRLRILEQSNEKYANAAASAKKEDDEVPAGTFRTSLKLPPPSIATDKQNDSSTSVAMLPPPGDGPTQALVGDYTKRPLPTPMLLQQQASELRQLERGQTPLLPSTQYNEDDDDDEYTAAASTLQPVDDRSVANTSLATNFSSIREIARAEKRAAKRARAQLEAALAALPAPQYEYELAVPDDNDDAMIVETVQDDDVVPDQADVEAAQREKERKDAEKAYQERNSVLKRNDLPRPTVDANVIILDDDTNTLIANEMKILLQHDAIMYPDINGLMKKKNNINNNKKRKLIEEQQKPTTTFVKPLEKISEDKLDMAKQLIQKELDTIMTEKINLVIQDGKASNKTTALEFLAEENARISIHGASNMIYVNGHWIEDNNNDDKVIIDSLKEEFDLLQQATASLKFKNDKLSNKINVKNKGYIKRSDKLKSDIIQISNELEQYNIDEIIYTKLYKQEQQGGIYRIDTLKNNIRNLRKLEIQLQKQYGELIVERRRKHATTASTKQQQK